MNTPTKDHQFIVGEDIEFEMYEFEKNEAKKIFVKAKIQVCYYFKNCARIGYFNLKNRKYEYRDMEFSSLRKIK